MVADCAVWKPKCTVTRLDFDRKQLKVVQGKGKKKTVTFHFRTLDSGAQKIHRSRKTSRLSLTDNHELSRWWFDNRYSQRGVQWAVKQVAKAAGIIKVHTHLAALLCHAFAGRRHGYHDAQRPLGHQMLRLQWNTCIAQLGVTLPLYAFDPRSAACSRK
jgi:hypothetical protein